MAMTVSGIVNSGLNYSGFFGSASNNRNAIQNSISNLWSNYSSAQNGATSSAARLQEIRANATALVSSYDEAKNEFYNEFDENMNRLSESAEALRNFDFKGVTAETQTPEKVFSAASKVISAVTETAEKETAQAESADTPKQEVTSPTAAAAKVIEAATKTNVDAESMSTFPPENSTNVVVNSDGSTTTIGTGGEKITTYGNGAITKTENYDRTGHMTIDTAYSKMMQSAFKTVNEFVENYNGTMEFFNENGAVSARSSKMAEIFADTKYRESSYESIGLNVNSDGTLAIDEEKLARAIVDNPDKVSDVLGKTGLADKAQDHIDFANSQRSQLFPSAQSMFGDQLSSASFYTSGAYINMNSFSTLGNLVNMMF